MAQKKKCGEGRERERDDDKLESEKMTFNRYGAVAVKYIYS